MNVIKARKLIIIKCLMLCVNMMNGQVKPNVPKVEGSYRTMGEIIYKYPAEFLGPNTKSQMYIEENYDKDNGLSSMMYYFEGTNATIFEDLNRNQYWLLTYKDGFGQPECIEMNESDFKNAELPWKIYQLIGKHEVLPIRQLLNLEDKYLTKWGEKSDYRGIPTLNYEHDIDTTEDGIPVRYEIKSAWSDGTQISPSVFKTVPLGFKIDKIEHLPEVLPRVTVRNINLFGFFHNDINHDMFLPIRGVSCPGIKDIETPFTFLDNSKSISFNVEFMINGNSSTRNYIDFWLDATRKLIQVDEYVHEEPQGSSTMLRTIFTAEQGAYYSYPLDDTTKTKSDTVEDDLKRLKFRPEFIIDHTNPNSYNLKGFFGTDKFKYVKTGMTTERGIPCTLYQTVRKDWPPGNQDNEIATVWEWCLADGQNVTYQGNSLPLVSLRIKVANLNKTSDIDWLFEGSQLSYQFYNVRKPDLAYLDTMVFDIAPCFSDNHRTLMQFQVKLSPDVEKAITNETSNFYFNSVWKSAITNTTVLNPTSLRVTSVRTHVPEIRKPMVVTFTLLERHPKLPRNIRIKEEELQYVTMRLEKAIDQGKVKINWKIGQKVIQLGAIPGTLQLQVTVKPTPSTNKSSIYSQVQVLDLIEKSHFMATPSGIYFRDYSAEKPEKLKINNNTIATNDLVVYLCMALIAGIMSGMIITYFIRTKYQRLD